MRQILVECYALHKKLQIDLLELLLDTKLKQNGGQI